MNRLFAELYLDEDVSVLIAELLRVRGFTAQTTQEAGCKAQQRVGVLNRATNPHSLLCAREV